MSEVSVEVRRDGPCAVVVAVGEFDFYNAGHLRDALASEVADASQRLLVVDLTRVTFFDSSALGVLVGARKRMASHDGSMPLVCTSPRLLRLFHITGLGKVFDICSSVEEATTRLHSYTSAVGGEPSPATDA